jgi:hypothetical protein
MNYFKRLVFLLSILVITIGFFQLNHENEIFAQSRMRCCNNGQCKGANCSAPSSINYGKYCGSTYLLTCGDCLAMEAAGLLDDCLIRSNEYCNED